MARFEVVFACLALVLVSVKCSKQDLNSNVKVAVVESLFEYLSEHPEVKLLQPLAKEVQTNGISPKILITYSLGDRISGDNLVATGSGNQSWDTEQDVALTLTYPTSGVGAVVTYIEIPVEQSSDLGQGYVTSGGIGQTQITVVIEALSTLYVKYSVEIYGY